jgi:hypothetical protein
MRRLAVPAVDSRDDSVADPRRVYEACLILEQRFKFSTAGDLLGRTPTPWATVPADDCYKLDQTAERRRKLIWSLELCVRR